MGVALLALDAHRLSLALGNDIAVIAEALPTLQRFAELAELPPRIANRFEVVFEEIVSNAIRHGFTKGSGQSVRVEAVAAADGLTLCFADDGKPFNPLERAEPAPLTDIQTAPSGGLGISLVRKLAASVDYQAGGPAIDAFQPVNRLTVVLTR
jgi:anti-sigma regulatory factor (Ser/Thr protein kinase)